MKNNKTQSQNKKQQKQNAKRLKSTGTQQIFRF